jgi:hypothetical protein
MHAPSIMHNKGRDDLGPSRTRHNNERSNRGRVRAIYKLAIEISSVHVNYIMN